MLSWLGRTTLRQRIGAIILLHALLLTGMLVAFVRLGPKDHDRLYMMPVPDRVAAIVTAFERAPPETYPDLVRAFQDDRQNVRLLEDRAPFARVDADTARSDAAARYRQALGGRPFRIEANGHDILGSLAEQPLFSNSPFRVIVALPNGSAVEIQRAIPTPVSRFLKRLTIVGVAVPSPQHATSPRALRAQVCVLPLATSTPEKPATGVGRSRVTCVPSPS